MSYLLDRKIKRKKIKKVALGVIILFFVFYFRVGILSGLSSATHFIFNPVLVFGNNIKNGFSDIGAFFNSKKLLLLENETLKLQQSVDEAKMSNYNSILDENIKLKEALSRIGNNKNMILGSILSKPNVSLYDTLIIDVGENNGISVGQRVFGYGSVPIGKISEVYPNSAKVVLYSSPGEKTDVVVSNKDTFMQIVGRGGGNFEIVLPRDFVIEKGTEVVLPGLTPHTVAIVQTILSDPRDSYQKALLTSPVNIFELKSVEVEK